MRNPFFWYRTALSLCIAALTALGFGYARMREEVRAGAEAYRAQTQELNAARQELARLQSRLTAPRPKNAVGDDNPVLQSTGHFYVAEDLTHAETEAEIQRRQEQIASAQGR